jgi:hypothetical protein
MTYSYESQDIIQFALKRLPGGKCRKKRFVRFSSPYGNELLKITSTIMDWSFLQEVASEKGCNLSVT